MTLTDLERGLIDKVGLDFAESQFEGPSSAGCFHETVHILVF